MIRQWKYKEAPEVLLKHRRGKMNLYNKEELNLQLLADQHNLCYICGRKLNIDFEIDHLRSSRDRPGLKYSWNNLFLCCRYCNVRKGHNYNNILDPLMYDIENLIYQEIDPIKGKCIFRATEDNPSEEVLETIELLDVIYNGRGDFRTTKEQRFYNYAHDEVNKFRKLCDGWLESGSDEYHSEISRELMTNAEMLGFKYWIVRSDKRLNEEFGKLMKWNRRI